jgi:hypothetical protein
MQLAGTRRCRCSPGQLLDARERFAIEAVGTT